MRHPVLCIIAVLAAFVARAERPDSLSFYWDVDMNVFFDNREGDSKYVDTRTFFMTRLAPEVGAAFASPGAHHRIAGGAVWAQPIGSEWDGYRLSPTLYYRYDNSRGITATLGMFGKGQLIEPIPDYIWSDSVNYWQRNVRGVMLRYQSTVGFFEAILDWRGMQSRTRREAFNIIARGEWHSRSGMFVAGGLGMMNHLARSSDPVDEQHVVDNFIINPYVGIRTPAGGKITAKADLGLLASLTRDRGDSDWLPRAGLWFKGSAAWRWLSADNTLYLGKALFPLYRRYGPLLDQGNPFYAADWTDRLVLSAALISSERVNLRAALDFNFAPGCFTFYQQLILSVNI